MDGVEKFVMVSLGALSLLVIGESKSNYNNLYRKYSHNVNKVQQGYIAPSKIEKIAAEDLDKNGELKTIMRVDGRNYLLKRDEKGLATLVPYEVEVLESEEKR